MKLLFLLATFVLLASVCCQAASEGGLTFYLQSVRGNDRDAPPTSHAKPTGPKLSERLSSVFKWRHYWELKQESIVVTQGHRIRRRMFPEREVEVELLDDRRMTTRIFTNGKLTRIRQQPTEAAFVVAGGPERDNQSWFIVVRRDRPVDSENN
jgi:hypothetical protein